MLDRRTFLKLAAFSLFPFLADPRSPSALITRLRRNLETAIGDLGIGLDLRKLNLEGNEFFRIQINADDYFPVASCFKTFLVLYYFWNTPSDAWEYDEGSVVYNVAVLSDNTLTSVLMAEVGERIDVFGNAVEKFNDFLNFDMGLSDGLYSWNEPDTPTENLSDNRFAPTNERAVRIPAGIFFIENVFKPSTLADAYAFLTRADESPQHPYFQAVLEVTREVMSIPARNYQSPIERAFPDGYLGKDGILPSDTLPTGRVVNDAGLIRVDDGWFIISLMSAGESESTILDLLRLIAAQIDEYQSSLLPLVPFP